MKLGIVYHKNAEKAMRQRGKRKRAEAERQNNSGNRMRKETEKTVQNRRDLWYNVGERKTVRITHIPDYTCQQKERMRP